MSQLASKDLSWSVGEWESTWLRGYLNAPWSFEETVARLKALSGQDPTANTDEYKVSVEFAGSFRGNRFTLYDYKGDNELHVGGTDQLDVDALRQALIAALADVTPAPYQADVKYDDEAGRQHGWSAEPAAPTPPPAPVVALAVPTVHLNGTSKQSLLEGLDEAQRNVAIALLSLTVIAPHARDYYPQGAGAYERADREHRRRVDRLVDVRSELLALAEAIQGGGAK